MPAAATQRPQHAAPYTLLATAQAAPGPLHTPQALLPPLPLGTLAANLIGGYLIGLALAIFSLHTGLSAQWRLFVITGFLGGLTTFSTFSGEVTSHLQEGRFGWAGVLIAVHVTGSLLMTLAGLATVSVLQKL